ncbi:uncharacterized protein PG986_006402 [Apiospora aurea]|uniref:Uncharacterized protein n=1 Tax=Apiospora aurea TaxID=335848 RepID=A0ABR1QKC7_9PEZI
MQTGPKPLYQVSAETEGATIEDGRVGAMEEQVKQPHITNLLTPPEAEELRAGAVSMLSLVQRTTGPISPKETPREPLHSDGSGLSDVRDGREESQRVGTDAADSSMAQKRDTPEHHDNTNTAPANSRAD